MLKRGAEHEVSSLEAHVSSFVSICCHVEHHDLQALRWKTLHTTDLCKLCVPQNETAPSEKGSVMFGIAEVSLTMANLIQGRWGRIAIVLPVLGFLMKNLLAGG